MQREDKLVGLIALIIDDLIRDGLEGKAKNFSELLDDILDAPIENKTIDDVRKELGHAGF